MMRNKAQGWVAGGLLGAAALAGLSGSVFSSTPARELAAPHAEGEYKLDPVHSHVIFKIKHLGTSHAYGMIHEPTGSFTIDAADPTKSTIEVSAKVENIDTGSPKRDEHLRSGDFFSAKEFPTLTFKSTAFKSAGENKHEVTGDLTMHGVTKPITAQLHVLGSGKGMRGGTVMGLEATFTIKRSDFGMNTYIKEGALGDEVSITVAIEGTGK